MIGTFRLNKGEVIQVLVGQEGGINKRRYSSGGGGGTFVVRGANTPLIIAGGGGGVQYGFSKHTKCDASTSTTDPIMVETIDRMNIVTTRLVMVR